MHTFEYICIMYIVYMHSAYTYRCVYTVWVYYILHKYTY